MKRGQVTIFIIIGLILLLVASLFIIMGRTIDDDIPDDDPKTHDFAAVSATYQSMVESCLQNEGASVFQRIMSNGGFYDPSEAGFVAIESMPLRGSALYISEDKMIPYWLQHSGGVSCQANCPMKINIPRISGSSSLPSIEEQAEIALATRMHDCTKNMRLGADYKLEQSDEIEVDITIADGAVTYQYQNLATIRYVEEDATKTVSSVTAQSPTRLLAMYEIGVSLLQQLEMSNVTSSYGDVIKLILQAYAMDDMAIPPMYGGSDFDTAMPKTWLLPDVEEDVSLYLADNIPMMQIRNSKNEQLFLDDNGFSQAIYHTAPFVPEVYLPKSHNVPFFNIDFLYLQDWGVDIDIGPGNGYYITPESTTFMPIPILRFGVTDYRFNYNLQMPLVVILSDDDSFDGEGLTLMYALETGLRNNEPYHYTGIGDIMDDEYNDLFGDDDQRLHGLINISAIDMITGAAIEDVQLNFLCGESSTTAGITNMQGYAITTLPFCLGGYIIASKEGYHAIPYRLSIFDSEHQQLSVQLAPIKTFDLELKKKILAKQFDGFSTNWTVGNSSGYMGPDDNVIYVLTRHSLPGEDEFIQTDMVNLSNQQGQTIDLTIGTYDLELFVIRYFGDNYADMDFKVEEDERCYDTNGILPGGEECQILPEIKFNDSMYIGGVQLMASVDTDFEIVADDYSNNELTLNYIEINLDDITVHEDLEVLGFIEPKSLEYNASLRPEFKQN